MKRVVPGMWCALLLAALAAPARAQETTTGSTRTTRARTSRCRPSASFIINWRGQHQIRYGVQDERIDYNNIVNVGHIVAYQNPMTLRLGARFEF